MLLLRDPIVKMWIRKGAPGRRQISLLGSLRSSVLEHPLTRTVAVAAQETGALSEGSIAPATPQSNSHSTMAASSPSIIDDFVMVHHNAKSESPVVENDGDHLELISHFIESVSSGLRDISLEIHDHPELQYKEYHAHKVLTEYMEEQEGWHVTPSAYGISTAFVAVYNSGVKGPTVSFNAEYGRQCTLNLRVVSP